MTLRQAVQRMLEAYDRWVDTPAPCPSGELLAAIEVLRQAATETALEELLSRLSPDRHRLTLRGSVARCPALGRPWCAKLLHNGAWELATDEDPAAALRSVLLAANLPVPAHSSPTEPPPSQASDDPPRSGKRATGGPRGEQS